MSKEETTIYVQKAVVKIKKIATLFFALSLVLNFILGAAVVQNSSIPSAEAYNEIKIPGTYGPPAMEIVDNDFTIGTAEATLQNTLITGDLHLTGEIEDGTITLNKVEVQGEVVIAASSDVTLILMDSSIGKITVQENGGAVTIIAQGSTKVDNVEIFGVATLQEDGLDEKAQGFRDVRVSTAKRVILLGDFDVLDIATSAADVKVVRGSVNAVNISSSATNAKLDLAKDVEVESMGVNARSTIQGEGTVETIDIYASGLTKLQGILGEVNVHVEGVFLELTGGSIARLVIPELEASTSIATAADTVIEAMELNARTGVTGKGEIGTVTINSSGVEIDQTPKTIKIEEGLVAKINGEEYKVEPKPEPTPEPKPEPQPTPPATPTVSLNTFNNVTITDFGKSQTLNVSTDGTNVTVSSSNNVAIVSISGNTITVTGNRQGTATITVQATRNGYNSRTRTFTVTVNPIKEKGIIDNNALTAVWVRLHNNDPEKYKVTISGTNIELVYDVEGSDVRFWAPVPREYLNNSIVVTRR